MHCSISVLVHLNLPQLLFLSNNLTINMLLLILERYMWLHQVISLTISLFKIMFSAIWCLQVITFAIRQRSENFMLTHPCSKYFLSAPVELCQSVPVMRVRNLQCQSPSLCDTYIKVGKRWYPGIAHMIHLWCNMKTVLPFHNSDVIFLS